jgi:hypothetical protein
MHPRSANSLACFVINDRCWLRMLPSPVVVWHKLPFVATALEGINGAQLRSTE